MDYKRIEIKSLGIGLLDITNLQLTTNTGEIKTYLAVGQQQPNPNPLLIKHNFIVTEKTVGINTTRERINSDNTNLGLLVQGNIKCEGSIYADNIILDNTNLPFLEKNQNNFSQILNRISSHLLFYNVRDYLQDNIYTNFNVIIGNQEYATNNTNSLKISRYANNYFSNIQFAIENCDKTSNTESTKISMGSIGNQSNSPAHIITSKGMPLQFNISKSTDNMNIIYNKTEYPNYDISNYPSLTLDTKNSVLINLDKFNSQLSYTKYELNNSYIVEKKVVSANPSLYVNGILYANTILTKDFMTNNTVNIDTLYVRKEEVGGLILNANRLDGNEFRKNEFTFTSNLYIGNRIKDRDNKYNLNVYGSINTSDNIDATNLLVRNNLTVNGNNLNVNTNTSVFNSDCIFNGDNYFDTIRCSNAFATSTLYLSSNLIYRGNLITFDIQIPNPIALQTTDTHIIENSLVVGGTNTGITDLNYLNEMISVYKYKEVQIPKFEIYLNSFNSKAYIGHNPLLNLNGNIDKSLIIFTEYNINWNNIYFYSGKNKNNLNSLTPNLAIMQNDRIGINTKNPEKSLDINGDIITSNYYIRNNNINYKCSLPFIYNNNLNNNNLNNLNINFNEKDYDNYDNSILKQFNVKGGINSLDGYYENNKELMMIKKIDNNNSILENTNLGLNILLNNSKITMPLQIRNNNTDNDKINNSVITFYKSKDNSKYSGIEFCDDATNDLTVNNNKWYIYKNHITDDISFIGPLKIGYMRNSYKPIKSGINIYYSKNDKYFIDINSSYDYKSDNEYVNKKENVRINGNVKINGDLEIDGSINITGNYKFNDNNILFSPNPVEKIINKIYSLGNNVYYFDTILSPNHPKNISFKNKIISSTLNSNIIFDTNTSSKNIDSNNTSNNSNVSYTNYLISVNNSNYIENLRKNFIIASNI